MRTIIAAFVPSSRFNPRPTLRSGAICATCAMSVANRGGFNPRPTLRSGAMHGQLAAQVVAPVSILARR